MTREEAPDVRFDDRGAYVMGGQARVPIHPMWWVVIEDDGFIDVKPPAWRAYDSLCQLEE